MPAIDQIDKPDKDGHRGLCVAAFDFDGTLTHGDTLLPFLATALGWPRFAWALPVVGRPCAAVGSQRCRQGAVVQGGFARSAHG